MKVEKRSQTVGFPVYALSFEPRTSTTSFFAGGGGGASKAGVPNAVVRFSVNVPSGEPIRTKSGDPLNLKPLALLKSAEHIFRADEDACMTLAVHPKERTVLCGVNDNDKIVKSGRNQNCRILLSKSQKLEQDVSFQTTDTLDSFYHQKVTLFNKNGFVLLTGCTDGRLSLWAWPDCQPYIPPLNFGAEILDADFDESNSKLVVVTPKSLSIIDPRVGSTVLQINAPRIGNTQFDFRSAKFGRRKPQWGSGYYGDNCSSEEYFDFQDYNDSLSSSVRREMQKNKGPEHGSSKDEEDFVGFSDYLYVLINSKDRKSSYICKWFMPGNLRDIPYNEKAEYGTEVNKPTSDYESITKYWKLVRKTRIASSNCSALAVSSNGKYLAVAVNKDYTLKVLNARGSMNEIFSVREAHGFAITALAFSPTDNVLVSGSADGTCLVVKMPKRNAGGLSIFTKLLLFIIFILLIAVGLLMIPDEFDTIVDQYIHREL